MKEKNIGGKMGGNESSSITRDWAITFDQDARVSNQTYSSNGDSQNTIIVTGGNVTILDTSITKTGNSSGDNADFYGTNAAIIAIKGNLELNNVTVDTNGAYANAVFSYGEGEISISDSTIKTKNKNSGGIMVTGGGKLTAKNVTVNTEGNSSAPIRSDRGGGTINIDGGEYTSNGVGSPAIYSTAEITVENAKLTATKSEGAIVEGKNSITLINSTLNDTNSQLNGKSTTYKNIFIYQSMSGDADEGTAKFTAKNSKIITNKGDTIYVTNTTAEILLENNEIINNDGDFLRIESAAWGKTGENGGNVTLELKNQNVKGDIVVDNISTLNIQLTQGSNFEGAINTDNQSQNISVILDGNSSWTLTSNSYISEITSSDESYSTLNLNGFSLYIGEEEITSIDQIPAKETIIENIETSEINENIGETQTYNTSIYVIGGICIIAIITTIGYIIKKLIK